MTPRAASQDFPPPAPARVRAVLDQLDRLYPDARCSLDHRGPLELLVATILSAQCTDERVNQVTPALFARYPDAQAYAGADLAELEELIRSTGFFRNKAKNLIGMARGLVERHGGLVPADLAALVQLPGIGRKTANVVLGECFGVPGVVVDTHVGRISQRLGFTGHSDPVKIEADLMALVPRERWTRLGHQLIQHGRSLCQAKKPACGQCPLVPYCAFGQAT